MIYLCLKYFCYSRVLKILNCLLLTTLLLLCLQQNLYASENGQECKTYLSDFFHELDLPKSGAYIRKDFFLSNMDRLINVALKEISRFENIAGLKSFRELLAEFEEILGPASEVYDFFLYLIASEDSQGLIHSREEIASKLDFLLDAVFKNEKIYSGLLYHYQNGHGEHLSSREKMMAQFYYFRFIENGMSLSREDRGKLFTLNERIQSLYFKLYTLLHLHLMDYELLIKKGRIGEDLEKFPLKEDLAAKRAAGRRRFEGYAFNFHFLSFHSFLTYASNRNLREEFYKHYIREIKTDTTGDFKNLKKEYIELSNQKARLLGYGNYRDYGEFQEELSKNAFFLPEEKKEAKDELTREEIAEEEREELLSNELKLLKNFALKRDKIDQLHPWDYEYYINLYKKKVLGIDDSALSDYLSLDEVLKASFLSLRSKAHLSFLEIFPHGDITKLHKNMRVFEFKKDGKLKGYIYLKVRHVNESLVQKKVLDHFAETSIVQQHRREGESFFTIEIKLDLNFLEGLPYFLTPRNFSHFISAFNQTLKIFGEEKRLMEDEVASGLFHYKSQRLIPIRDLVLLLKSNLVFKNLYERISSERRQRSLDLLKTVLFEVEKMRAF